MTKHQYLSSSGFQITAKALLTPTLPETVISGTGKTGIRFNSGVLNPVPPGFYLELIRKSNTRHYLLLGNKIYLKCDWADFSDRPMIMKVLTDYSDSWTCAIVNISGFQSKWMRLIELPMNHSGSVLFLSAANSRCAALRRRTNRKLSKIMTLESELSASRVLKIVEVRVKCEFDLSSRSISKLFLSASPS